MNIENVILSNLVCNEDFTRRALPFIKKDYFADSSQGTVFEIIEEYVDTYNALPSKQIIKIELDKKDTLSEDQYKNCLEALDTIETQKDTVVQDTWLLNETEKFCQNRAIYNAIREAIKVIDDKSGKTSTGILPQLLSDALAVSFDTSIGHDFMEDADKRFEFYHRREERIPFDIDILNTITKGGLPRKTINVLLAGTGAGKTLAMCHMAAANLMLGKNVLYITMEMAQEKIAERIDANLLDVTLDDLYDLPKDVYDKKIARLKTTGKLIIKEYPTSSAGAANFRHLLNELRIKKNFIPDIIYVDYINICMSSRLKNANNVNSYSYVKAIAEELRALAVEFNVPLVTATQTTRGGYDNSDVGLTDTSESFGLPATADFMVALIVTEDLIKLNQLMIKQLKNRYSDPDKFKRFVVGMDRSRMRLYNTNQSAQDDLVDDSDDRIVFDHTDGSRYDKYTGEVFSDVTGGKFDKGKFEGFR